MKKIELKNKLEVVSPDFVQIYELGIKTKCTDKDAIPLIYTHRFDEYGIGPLFMGSYRITHKMLFQYLGLSIIKKPLTPNNFPIETFLNEDLCLRIWLNNNIITSWGDDYDIVNSLKEIKKCFNTNLDYFYKEDNEVKHIHNPSTNIDFGKLKYMFEGYEEDEFGMDRRYAYWDIVNNLISNNTNVNKSDDSKQQEFHLMTPDEKAEYLKNNDEKRQERINYLKKGEKVWNDKHPGWDPAHYHLTFWEESKTMKITENDIKQMVNETIKRILKEDYEISPFTYFNSCTEKLNRLIQKIEDVKQELPNLVEILQKNLLQQYGVQLNIKGNKLDETGLSIFVEPSLTNDAEEIEPEDIEFYIEDSIDEIFNDYRRNFWFVENISYYKNILLIEFDEFNPISIESKLPDV